MPHNGDLEQEETEMVSIAHVIPITEFRNKARSVLQTIKDRPVVITQRGRPAAVLESYERYREREERLRQLEIEQERLLEQAEEEALPPDKRIAKATFAYLGHPMPPLHPLRESPVDWEKVSKAMLETYGTDDAVEIINMGRQRGMTT